jgi:Zn-dependent protease
MLFTLNEVLDVLIMTVGVGYIFMDIFKIPKLAHFNWRGFWLSCLVTAPGIILHELGHKFIALTFGAQAVFHAAYKFLALGIILKLISSPFIFFVPGYVSITPLPAVQSAFVAFAGPAVNGLLYLAAVIALQKQRSPKWQLFWCITRRLNGFLFLFNMLPIPGFDGFHVISSFLVTV